MRSFVRVGAAVALASAGAVVAIGSGTAGAEPVTQEFEFTGAAQEFVVPADVCSLSIDAFGAQGGNGAFGTDDAGLGGEGGRATATIPVTPGETLAVYVGGQGEPGPEVVEQSVALADEPQPDGDVSAQAFLVAAQGGFNGGGDSLFPAEDEENGSPGGGGGGASDVRQGGNALENRVVVGGGGGGGGGEAEDQGDPGDSNGGGGGGLEGEDGAASGGDTPGGEGGTQTAGGAAPSSFDPTATSGDLGVGGVGGAGANDNDGGAGGGGGYYGGGGGAGDVESSGDGGGGGGGSGFGPAGTTFETGNQFGDGLVIISYDPALQTCPIAVEPRFTG